LSASLPSCQSRPAWSMNCFSCAATLPNRVGVPKATPSAHSMSSSDATGSSSTSERCRPQVLVLGDDQLRGELLDVANAQLRPFASGSLGERVRKAVHVSRRAVVDDGDSGRSRHRIASTFPAPP
jgi:hypothetical protein